MGRLYCVHLTPTGEHCEECEAATYISTDEVVLPSALHLDTGRTEREDLVLRFMLVLAPTQYYTHPQVYDTLLLVCANLADSYLKWREEERKK